MDSVFSKILCGLAALAMFVLVTLATLIAILVSPLIDVTTVGHRVNKLLVRLGLVSGI